MKNKSLLALCVLAGTGVLPAIALVSCGGNTKPPDTAATSQPSDSSGISALDTAGSAASTATASPASSATADTSNDTSPLAQILTTDSGQITKIFDAASSAPAATLKPSGSTGGDVLGKGIRDAGKKLPAGMQPDGPLAMGSLKEKQHLQTDITMQPGKCYSIVGFSKNVKDLDLYLLLPPGILSGQDLTDDNRPIIGGPPQPMCPIATTPVTYKLDIYADQGAGDVAVQLYSKGK